MLTVVVEVVVVVVVELVRSIIAIVIVIIVIIVFDNYSSFDSRHFLKLFRLLFFSQIVKMSIHIVHRGLDMDSVKYTQHLYFLIASIAATSVIYSP